MFRRASAATLLLAALVLASCLARPVLPAAFVAVEPASSRLCKKGRSTSRVPRLRTKAGPLLTLLPAGGLVDWRAAVGGLASLGSLLGLVLGLRLKLPGRKHTEKTGRRALAKAFADSTSLARRATPP